MNYRYKVEFEYDDYKEIDDYCRKKNMHWFASPWDVESVDFLEQFKPLCYKIPSACATDMQLISYIASKSKPVIISTGMCTSEQIDKAIKALKGSIFSILHCTSFYPSNPDEINLSMIKTT